MEIGDRIRILRTHRGMTQSELAKAAGTTMQTIYKYEKNIVTNIPYDRFILIANALNTTPAHLMGWDNDVEAEELTRIPIIGSVVAGVPLEECQDIDGYIEISGETSNTFALRVDGDSMNPELHDKDTVIIKRQNSYKNGDIVVARVNGNKYTVKKYRRSDDKIMLIPVNSDFDVMMFDASTVCIEGKVVEVRRKYA